MHNQKEIIKQLKDYMERNKLSQDEIAKMVHTRQPTVSRWLSSKKILSPYIYLLIAEGVVR